MRIVSEARFRGRVIRGLALAGIALFVFWSWVLPRLRGHFGHAQAQVHAPAAGEGLALRGATRDAGNSGATIARPSAIDVDGTSRRFMIVVPREEIRGKRYPLVLVFHGDGGDAEGFHHAIPFEEATGADAILAYPEGVDATWDLETTDDNKDVRFLEQLIARIEAEHAIDHARIFAMGYSSGGFFSSVLACQRPGLIRAISSSAGGAPYHQRETWPNGYPKCPGQMPTAMIALHGTRDFGVTLESGRFSAEYWAYVNGCNGGSMSTTDVAQCNSYDGCAHGRDVAFCVIDGLGHWVWDEAPRVSWTFFQHESE